MIARHRSMFAMACLLGGAPLAALTVAACSKDDKGAGATAASAAPSASAAPPSATPACVVEAEKVWASDASATAGIAETDLDTGRVAFGVLLGGKPEVVVFDAKGEGEQKHVGVKKTLTDAIPKGTGRREIHRVTPATGAGGETVAFVDYDQVGTAHRTVACGPSDSTTELLKFDGKPLLTVAEDAVVSEKASDAAERKDVASAPVTPAAPVARASSVVPGPSKGASPRTASAAPGDRHPPVLREIGAAHIADARKRHEAAAALTHAPAPAASTPKPAEKPTSPKGDKVRELRDCRTFVDHGGAHPWTTGSELVGQPQDDGSTEWSMDFFAALELGRGRVTLASMPLGKSPTKLPVYEAPTALDLGQGEFSLATRARGTLFAWLLDATKHARGPMRTFSGMAPGAPRFASFGAERALLVVTHDASEHAVARSLGFDPSASQLPATLTDLSLGGLPLTGPMSGVIQGTQRFVAVQSDETARRLTVLSVDATLSSLGAPLLVDSGVFESRLVPIADGRLLLVYLRAAAAGHVELVSRTVKCG